jgi:hypothetical protein
MSEPLLYFLKATKVGVKKLLSRTITKFCDLLTALQYVEEFAHKGNLKVIPQSIKMICVFAENEQ